MSSEIWTESLKIHSYDVDLRQQATLEALCRYFLEAAWNHAEALGVGFSHLAKNNRVWVLSRLLFHVTRYPRWGESLALHTWPRPGTAVFALRDFELFDSAGANLAGGTSAWLVLDAPSRRPQRIDKLLGTIQTVNRQATTRDPDKLPESAGAGALSQTIPSLSRIAQYGDVDLNGHVNSARYIGWLLDCYPLEWHEAHAPTLFEINYLGESRAGDSVSILTAQTAPAEFSHSIYKAEDRELCRARIEWS